MRPSWIRCVLMLMEGGGRAGLKHAIALPQTSEIAPSNARLAAWMLTVVHSRYVRLMAKT